ncbi:hypothetical protein D3250_07655 [Nesterenkonia natronophila]|uniref:Uncharacterized protein n=2 Tax=Nesterenkonia natronophila TaxID=2174932 RepID=A0A3A4F665_9MICC|nr:hypothetical protein D3250_07655 [Nesterenkonia natronophila]
MPIQDGSKPMISYTLAFYLSGNPILLYRDIASLRDYNSLLAQASGDLPTRLTNGLVCRPWHAVR